MNNLLMLITVIIIICFFAPLKIFFSNKKKTNKYIEISPSILLNIGILGTFVGLCFSLYHFNVDNIDSSIIKLLDGLKTAFLTSAFGLFLSIILKIIIETQKIDSSDFVQEMSKAFNRAADKIIKDFNSKLKYEFGENFKELDSSVSVMLGWQKTNAKYLKTIFGQYEKTNTQFSNISNSLSEISNKSESIVSAFKSLDDSKDDFEKNIIQFNKSVQLMTKWETQHSENISNIYTRHERVVGSIETFKNSFSAIDDYSKKIVQIYSTFNKSITQVENNQALLETTLNKFHKTCENLHQIMVSIDNPMKNIKQNE